MLHCNNIKCNQDNVIVAYEPDHDKEECFVTPTVKYLLLILKLFPADTALTVPPTFTSTEPLTVFTYNMLHLCDDWHSIELYPKPPEPAVEPYTVKVQFFSISVPTIIPTIIPTVIHSIGINIAVSMGYKQ